MGTTDVPARPERVVSASVTMTGHLLAVGAPVVATMTTAPGPLTDEGGFFRQWSEVAQEDGVDPIPGPEIDVEAIAVAEPDLIVASAFGSDAVDENLYDTLDAIAPTLVFDHTAMSWQDLTLTLGEVTGRDEAAAEAIAAYDEVVAASLPNIDTSRPVTAFTIPGDGTLNVFTPESAHGKLLAALGLEISGVEGAATGLQGGDERTDVVAVAEEGVQPTLGDSTLLVVLADQAALDQALSDSPLLASVPAIDEGRVHALGPESFRLDRYSAELIVRRLAEEMG